MWGIPRRAGTSEAGTGKNIVSPMATVGNGDPTPLGAVAENMEHVSGLLHLRVQDAPSVNSLSVLVEGKCRNK